MAASDNYILDLVTLGQPAGSNKVQFADQYVSLHPTMTFGNTGLIRVSQDTSYVAFKFYAPFDDPLRAPTEFVKDALGNLRKQYPSVIDAGDEKWLRYNGKTRFWYMSVHGDISRAPRMIDAIFVNLIRGMAEVFGDGNFSVHDKRTGTMYSSQADLILRTMPDENT